MIKKNNNYLVSFKEKVIDKFVNDYNMANAENKITDQLVEDICSDIDSYAILQYQPETELILDVDTGFTTSNNTNYIQKFNSFFELTYNEKYSLVLTPEYSVPIESLIKIIENRDKIMYGTLYCICCQGISINKYKELINNIETLACSDIIINNLAFNKLTIKRTVCVLFYLLKAHFVLEDGNFVEKIFLAPQFKTTPMRDENFDYESRSLSLGKCIFYFGKENGPKFMSILCADALNLDLTEEIRRTDDDEIILFHPQLNLRPNNIIFQNMRELLLNYYKRRIRIITLNWAKNTKMSVADKVHYLQEPWSGYYFGVEKSNLKNILSSFAINAKYGFDFAIKNNMGFWFVSPSEHITSYLIESSFTAAVPNFVHKKISLLAEKTYTFCDNTLQINKELCKEGINEFFKNTKEFAPLFFCDGCTVKTCTKCKLNEFSSLVFDKKDYEQYAILLDGQLNRISSDQYISSESEEKIMICKRVFGMIKNKNMPRKYSSLEPIFCFDIVNEYGNDFNVVYNDKDFGKILCRVVYLKSADKSKVNKKYEELKRQYGKLFFNDIVILYDDDTGYHYFPENHDTSILENDKTAEFSTII